MKTLIFIFSLLFLVNCQTAKKIEKPLAIQNNVVRDTNYISEQEALGAWLMSQPQQVRDDFKRDFVFSGDQIKQLVDPLKNNLPKDLLIIKENDIHKYAVPRLVDLYLEKRKSVSVK